jgi:2-polyprenyl-3-methyl-5-hydroxy-6-metoxy-1,4-benzoquinol methylase
VNYSEWENFWKNQKQSFHSVMKIATTAFAARLEKEIPITSSVKLLDYGCGPGFLADYYAIKNISFTGLDINASFIEECKKNHSTSRFLLITTNAEENNKIFNEQLHHKQFDVITILSIVQYFSDEKELEDLIGILVPYLTDSGVMVLADIIDEHTSSIKDATSLLLHCIKKGKIVAFTKFIFYLLFSNYSDISKRNKLLLFSEQSINRIARSHSLSYRQVKNLTIHPSRTNYILSNTTV